MIKVGTCRLNLVLRGLDNCELYCYHAWRYQYIYIFFCRNCRLCGFKAKSNKRLREHVRNIHELKYYQCDICSHGNFNKIEMEFHVKSHIRKEPQNFFCEFCSKEFDKVIYNSNLRSCCSTALSFIL